MYLEGLNRDIKNKEYKIRNDETLSKADRDALQKETDNLIEDTTKVKPKISTEKADIERNIDMMTPSQLEEAHDELSNSDDSYEAKVIRQKYDEWYKENEATINRPTKDPVYEEFKLVGEYKDAVVVSDDWFTEEGRKIGMSDEAIAKEIYNRKGAEAQNSSDDNIKRILAGMKKEELQTQLSDLKKQLDDPSTSDEWKKFYQSEVKSLENQIDRYDNYEAEFISRIKRDDETFTVKYYDKDFTENFKATGLDEAFAMRDEWSRYSPDVYIYDTNGNEILQDKDKRTLTTPKYEENKLKQKRQTYRNTLYGSNRGQMIAMVHNLGLNWNVDRFTDAQLYRMLEKELAKK